MILTEPPCVVNFKELESKFNEAKFNAKFLKQEILSLKNKVKNQNNNWVAFSMNLIWEEAKFIIDFKIYIGVDFLNAKRIYRHSLSLDSLFSTPCLKRQSLVNRKD